MNNDNLDTNHATNGNGAAPLTKATDAQAIQRDTYIQPPPAGLVVPQPPAEFQAGAKGNNRGSALQGAELAALPDAAKELAGFSDYVAVLGKTAPPQAQVVPAVAAVAAWYTLLTSTQALLSYIRVQGGAAWHDSRVLINGLRRPWESACAVDPTLATQFPALTRFLSVKKVNARKGAARRAKEKAAAAARAAAGSTTHATPAVNAPHGPGAASANGAPRA